MTGDDGAAPEAGADVAAEAAAMFGAALQQAEQYAGLLTGIGAERGIVGPGEAARVWDRHVLNCGVIARLIPATCSLVDLGSGAGLPGIVVAMLRPESRVTLLEPMARRAGFLQECVTALGLANVEVVRGRAEEFAGRLAADVVTSRAVAPLEKLAGLSAGLARPGGRVLAMKGSSAAAELARARPVLARLGIGDARLVTVASASGAVTATLVIFTTSSRSAGSAPKAGWKAAQQGPDGGRPGRQAAGANRRQSRPNSRRGGG
ncbi:MAG: 16S rRNA (guanine(527)-N(7))-methyltransferase RsmG [Streptosporangiaceae bacterium]